MTISASHLVFLGLGSNDQPCRHLPAALDFLEETLIDVSVSPVYKSASPQKNEANPYYNAVVKCLTDQPIGVLRQILRDIEARCGRDRSRKPVAIDIDLLLYGEEVGNIDGMTLPRTEIVECGYILRPLSDLYPAGIHPITQQTYAELWACFCEQHDPSLLHRVDFFWRHQQISTQT